MFQKTFSSLEFNSRRLSLHNTDVFNWKKQEKIIMEPFVYMKKAPGKYHRLMAPAFNHWLQVPADKLHGIQEAMRTLVTWNILTDDIQDDSPFRFGLPSAHRVYGLALTINAASKALLLGQKQVLKLGHPSGTEIFFKRIDEFLDGQGIDVYWANNYICPTEEAHIAMSKKRSGSFFAFPVELMQLFSSKKEDYVQLALNIGVYYNIVDDYYNLFSQKELAELSAVMQDNHKTCSDITEGKISLSVIHASQFPDVAEELRDIFKQRTSDPKLHQRVISLLKKHGSDEYARDALRTVEAEIRAEIERFGGNAILTAFMDKLSFQKQESELNLDMYEYL